MPPFLGMSVTQPTPYDACALSFWTLPGVFFETRPIFPEPGFLNAFPAGADPPTAGSLAPKAILLRTVTY